METAPQSLNALALCHRFLQQHVPPGALCIDATAGRGRDTVLLCRLCGENGRVVALDIQQQAVESTRALLWTHGLADRARVVCDTHRNIARYATPGSVDAVVFNLGFLPGGDHSIYSKPQDSIPAITDSLSLLRPGGVISICVYYGGDTGFEERDALLSYLPRIDSREYTVLHCSFMNRGGCPPFPVFIMRHTAP